ncbi:MAG: DUF1326 domain-containing protein [Planctomycetes bacterium]|nr:DUF1326 domain-containing protein [Planctomycetota bacterium]
MFRVLVSVCVGILAATGAAAVLHFHGRAPRFAPASGSYVEARTASVFAGACHYNGELVTAGREALLAWHFDGGIADGLELAGLDAVAIVRAAENLKLAEERSSIVYVGAALDARERAALLAVIELHSGGALGRVREVRGTDLRVDIDDERYSVRVGEFAELAELEGALDPDRACCHMPQNVWYEPLAPIQDRRVGKSDTFAVRDASFGAPWAHHDANDAFVGRFAGVSTCCPSGARTCCPGAERSARVEP